MQPDGGTLDASLAPDVATDEAPSTGDAALEGAVSGTAITTYRMAGSAEERPRYVGSSRALVEQRGGGFEAYAGVDQGDGRFAIPDVPDGEFYVTLNGRDYLHTQERELDLGRDRWGPRNGSLISTSVAIDLDGLEPWEPSDELYFHAPDIGATSFGMTRDLDPEPSYLDNEVDADWRYFDLELSAERGYLSQFRLELVNGVAIRSPVTALELADVTIGEDGDSRIEGTLEPVDADRDLQLDWRLSEFAVVADDLIPGASDLRCEVKLLAIPGEPGRDHQLGQPSPARVADDCEAGDVSIEAVYGDPFPDAWNRYVLTEAVARESAELDGASWQRNERLSQLMSLDELDGEPLRPALSAVRFLRVGGFEATEPLEDVSPTPVVTWNEPRLGAPNGYEVTVYHLDTSPGFVRQARTVSIVTSELRVRIPPDAMEPGEHYVIEVAALYEPEIDLATSPYRRGFPSARAERVTAVLHP